MTYAPTRAAAAQDKTYSWSLYVIDISFCCVSSSSGQVSYAKKTPRGLYVVRIPKMQPLGSAVLFICLGLLLYGLWCSFRPFLGLYLPTWALRRVDSTVESIAFLAPRAAEIAY